MARPPSLAQVIAIAAVCHEANKAYCESLGDFSQEHWDKAPVELRNSAIHGVQQVADGIITSDSSAHDSWMKEKLEAGWTHGDKKSIAKKTHPNLLPFHMLPDEQQLKDRLFYVTAITLLGPFRL